MTATPYQRVHGDASSHHDPSCEDLAVKSLARTRPAKSMHDASWSMFVAMMDYKAAKHGRYFGKIGRFEPTSQVCSACGIKDGLKPLSVREWTCGECETVHDRDVNAPATSGPLDERTG